MKAEIERLRANITQIMRDDLTEIERLRTENAEMRLALEAPTKFELELRAEIERLRAENAKRGVGEPTDPPNQDTAGRKSSTGREDQT